MISAAGNARADFTLHQQGAFKMQNFETTLIKRQGKWLQKLNNQGYCMVAQRQNRKALDEFIKSYKAMDPPNPKLTPNDLRVLAKQTVENISKNQKWSETIIERFIKYLVQNEDIKDLERIKLENTLRHKEAMKLSDEYEEYLRNLRGLAERSIINYCEFLRHFLDFTFGESAIDLPSLTRKNCVDYLEFRVQAAPNTRGLPGNLRNVLNFLFWAGYINSDLAKNIPRQRVKHAKALPKYLPKEDIDRLAESVRNHPKRGKRDYAMLLLMAIAGLRAREVVRVRLEDIYWEEKEMLIRGKGLENEVHPVNNRTLSAIKDYIENERIGDSEYLFLTIKAPYRPYKDGSSTNDILKEAFLRTGICPAGKYVGSRVFRHSLATDMVAKGISLEFISTYMRHKSKDTTRIYAKLDIEALRSITPDQPKGGVAP